MMRSFLLVAALGVGLLAAGAVRAETFLGEDGDGKASVQDEPAPSPKKRKKKKKAKPQPVVEAADDDSAEAAPEAVAASDDSGGGSPLVFSGALGSGSGYINGQVTVGYYFNKYIGIDTSYFYYRFDSNNATGQQYGPEVDLVLRLANPTIVTPYVGAGPGYTKWQRSASGQSFDARSSWTGNEFVGVDVRLTSHFGIGIVRKQQTYLSDPPKSFDDHKVTEAKSTWATNIGFRIAF